MSRCGICHQVGEHDHEAHVVWRTEAAYRTLAVHPSNLRDLEEARGMRIVPDKETSA